MNLKKLFDKIAVISKTIDPNIGHVLYGDVYELNHIQTVEYPAVVVTVGNHGANLNDYTLQYRLNIFYIDRLTDDKGNKIDVHANSIVFLNTLLKELDEDLMISEGYEIINFNERFNDVCSGAYVTVRVGVPIEICDMPSIEYITNLKDIKITENGLYKAPYGTAYKNIDVDVPGARLREQSWTFDRNQTLTILPGLGYDGMSKVHIKVDVPGVPVEVVKNIIEGTDGDLIIPEGITKINQYTFYSYNYNATPAENLIIADSVTTIGYQAFRSAWIKNIYVPSSVTSVDSYVFYYCNRTEYVEFNPIMNNIPWYTFSSCSALKKLVIGMPILREIGNSCFSSCSALEEIDFSQCTQIPSMPWINSFSNVPTTCEIKVPAALYDQWIRATNWSTLYAQGYRFTAV